MSTRYRSTALHSQDLASGQMLDPGEETSKVNPDDPHDARLIDEGLLLKLSEPKSKPAPKKTASTDNEKED